jgi:hypothetical protein
VNPDIERAIEQLDAKIASLQRARDVLVDTFCPPDSPRRKTMAAPQPCSVAGAPAASESDMTLPSGMRLRRRLKRKDIVAEYIRQYGPSARADILAGTGIPPGSVAFVLNDKARFTLKDGKWHNVGEGSSSVFHEKQEQPVAPAGTEESVPEAEPRQL